MSFTVNVSHGASKHKVVLEGPNTAVDDLKAQVEEITEVPSDMQKIIFKGKTLQNGAQEVGELGMKEGSRLILMGRKHNPEQEASFKRLNDIAKSVDGVEAKIMEIQKELEGIQQGFLQAELITEAHKGLKKRCIACSEFLMQNMENLDALDIPPTETLVRGKRKAAVQRIQALLEKTDELSKRISSS